MKKACSFLATGILFLTLLNIQARAQTQAPATQVTPSATIAVNDGITRPADTLGIGEVDAYVTRCYDFHDQTTAMATQLNAIEQHVLVGKTENIDTKALETQLNNFKAQITTLKLIGDDLMQKGSIMTDKVTARFKSKPFKIPHGIIMVKNATKAVKVSVKSLYNMLTVTIVNIKHKLNIPVGPDNSKNQLANSGKTATTSISITGIGYSAFNSLSKELTGLTGTRSTSKKFNASGASEIDVVYSGSTDDLLNAMLANCKDVITEKNIAGTEDGKINLSF